MISTHMKYLLGGVVLGGIGPSILTSDAAKRVYVQCIAAGMRAKAAYQDLVEQARAEVGDMVAEATYINTKAAAEDKAATTDKAAAEDKAATTGKAE